MTRSIGRLLVLSLVLVLAGAPLSARAARLMADIIDVGQGDAILLTDGDGSAVLIDAGNSFLGAGPRIERHLAARGIQRLRAVVISHAHVDHYGGLTHLLDKVKIDEVLYGTRVHTPMYAALEKALLDRGIPYHHVSACDRLPLPAPIEARVVQSGPEELPAGTLIMDTCTDGDGTEGVDLNMFSVVVRVSLGKRALLLTGDAPGGLEDQMVAAHTSLGADILKVSHHGSGYSSTDAFLKAVHPSEALISCGKGNDYGHPHADSLARLKKSGAFLRRTDREGTLTVNTDGEHLSVNALGIEDALWRLAERSRLFDLIVHP